MRPIHLAIPVLLLATAAGATGCTVSAYPAAGVVSASFAPLYYGGYPVYYTNYGVPYYYGGGGVHYIPRSYHLYDHYVGHYYRHRLGYHDWYARHRPGHYSHPRGSHYRAPYHHAPAHRSHHPH